jgi:hypothetical protein
MTSKKETYGIIKYSPGGISYRDLKQQTKYKQNNLSKILQWLRRAEVVSLVTGKYLARESVYVPPTKTPGIEETFALKVGGVCAVIGSEVSGHGDPQIPINDWAEKYNTLYYYVQKIMYRDMISHLMTGKKYKTPKSIKITATLSPRKLIKLYGDGVSDTLKRQIDEVRNEYNTHITMYRQNIDQEKGYILDFNKQLKRLTRRKDDGNITKDVYSRKARSLTFGIKELRKHIADTRVKIKKEKTDLKKLNGIPPMDSCDCRTWISSN